MNFASDNAAGVAPEILAAIARANDGAALAYGRDDWTKRVERRFAELFEREVAVFLVPTGTAANALALAHLTPPWGAVLCHAESHIATDECGAPEFFGGGIKLIGLPGAGGKIAPETLQDALEHGQWGGPHHVSPSVLSLSQVTEAGTIYRPHELRRLAEIAHGRGLAVHLDGARLANALARMNASPAEATWQAGIDALSFGATKNGALAAEAVVFFDPARGANMQERRKRGGHLVSKHRFIAAQMEAYLADGLWLRLARHANAMADRLAERLSAAGLGAGLAGRGQRGVRRAAGARGRTAQGRRRQLLSLEQRRAPGRHQGAGRRRPGAAGDLVRHNPRGSRPLRCNRAGQLKPRSGQRAAPIGGFAGGVAALGFALLARGHGGEGRSGAEDSGESHETQAHRLCRLACDRCREHRTCRGPSACGLSGGDRVAAP